MSKSCSESCSKEIPKRVRLCHHPPTSTTTHHHPPPAKMYPPPAKYILHHSSPPTISQNISTITHHHPPTAKIYPPPPITTHHQPKYIHHPPAAKIYLPATLLKRRPWHRCFPVNFAKFLRTSTVASVRCRTASVCCRRKVAAVKIENLKTFIIKYYDIRKTYSVQFHLFYLVTFSYFYFFIHGFRGSRTIAPEKNCPQPQN